VYPLSDLSPGFNGFDWLVGIIGAALLRLFIYYKVKNAKNYRKDVEYGSARWGTLLYAIGLSRS